MRSLKEVLLEKLENTNAARTAVEEYINANYDVKGILTFENVNGVCIVNCNGNVKVKNKKIEKLTDGFEWGNVKGDFICSTCINLKSLEGAPENVGGNFDCRGCIKLTSLKGTSKTIVVGKFDCRYCPITSMVPGPKKVGSIISDINSGPRIA